jgi:hypothetical protein
MSGRRSIVLSPADFGGAVGYVSVGLGINGMTLGLTP